MPYWDFATDAARVARWASLGSNNLTESVSATAENWNGTGAYLPKPTAPPAVEGNSFSLSGSNYIECGNLGAAASNTVTLCGWVYDDGATGGPDPVLYDRNTNCGVHTYDSTRWGYTWDGLGWDWSGGPTRSPGEWVYLALRVDQPGFRISIRTRSTAGTVKFAENIVGPNAIAYAPNMMIGADTILPDRRFVGRLNDLRIFNRVLTDAELDDLALGPEPTNTTPPTATFSGGVLTCTTNNSDWNAYSNGSITYSHQWQRFSGSWTNVGSASSPAGPVSTSTYTPTLAGDHRCVVTATNNGGSHLPANSNTVTVTLGRARLTNYLTANRLTNYRAA
jgi:hypothetical protein